MLKDIFNPLWFACLVLVALIAPMSIDLEILPLTLQTLVLFIAFSVLDPKASLALGLAYLALGSLGLPVFGSYTGGWEKLIGPTSGFLWGFLICAAYINWEIKQGDFNFFQAMLTFLKAHGILLIPGFIVLYFQVEGLELWPTLVRLIPGILIKSIAGGLIAAALRNRLKDSQLIS